MMEKYSMETLEEKIQKTVLTKTDRKIADYLLDHKDTISFKLYRKWPPKSAQVIPL